MKLNKVEEKKNLLKVELEGESHTFPGLLCSECEADQVSYNIEHPLTSSPVVTVVDNSPKAALLNASKKVVALCRQFKTKLK